MVRAALNEACLLRLPDVDKLSPRMLGIDERRFRSVRYFRDPATKAWTRFEPWQQVKGRRGRAVDKAWAHRMLLLRAGDTLTPKAAHRMEEVFTADDLTGTLQAVWMVKEQLSALVRTGSLEDAAAAKVELEKLVKAAARAGVEQALPHCLPLVERD